jgi:exoribonuclease-2
MNKPRHVNPDLVTLAVQELRDAGFYVEFPASAVEEAEADAARPGPAANSVRDLRELLWSSIDNEESKDLDQVEFAELLPNGDIRLLIGVADVDHFVPKGSAIDQFASHNTVSVYTPVAVFPMLPPLLSNDTTSLLEGADRLVVVTELVVGNDGGIRSRAFYRATLRNHAKLDYASVGAWLEGSANTPARVRAVQGLADQIRLQYEATLRLRRLRRANGALEFDSAESDAISSNGVVTEVVLRRHNRARDIIEGFMIAANTQMAAFLEERNIPSLRRVVRTPERWPRIVELASTMGVQLPSTPDARALSSFLEARRRADPDRYPELSLTVMKLMGPGDYRVESPGVEQEGHFGLAVQDYTHSTAPNRRFPDLVTQRLVKATLENSEMPYSVHELEVIAEQCTRMEDLARKIERTTMKAAIATFLAKRIGEEFDGIITGAKKKGTFVRISNPPAEGMLVEGADGLDVGDHVRVRLVSTDPKRGYIDFARA